MHHYPFHVGDYIRATAHLDIVEDCIYRRLIDLYMETELPIPNETQQVIRRLRLGSSGLILETILREFFTLEADNCWHNSRCDQEISEYKRLADVSRINGKLGGRPKKTQRVISDNPAGTQQEPSGLQPRTTNHEPRTNKERSKTLSDYSDEFEQFWKAYPKKTAKGDAWKSWKKEKPSLQVVLNALSWQTTQSDWIKEKGQFIPLPATYLNQRRFDDGDRAGGKKPFDMQEFQRQTGAIPTCTKY